jgi:hypothetical protein
MKKYWVSSKHRGTGQVDVKDGCIVAMPSIWRKFKGQPLENLLQWLRQDGLQYLRLYKDIQND